MDAARRPLRGSAAACAASLVLLPPRPPIRPAQPPPAMAWLREPIGSTLAGFASALGGVGRIPLPFGAPVPSPLVAAGALVGVVLLVLATTTPRARRDPDTRSAV